MVETTTVDLGGVQSVQAANVDVTQQSPAPESNPAVVQPNIGGDDMDMVASVAAQQQQNKANGLDANAAPAPAPTEEGAPQLGEGWVAEPTDEFVGYKATDDGLTVKTKEGQDIHFDNDNIQIRQAFSQITEAQMHALGQGIASKINGADTMKWLSDMRSSNPMQAKEALDKLNEWSNIHTDLKTYITNPSSLDKFTAVDTVLVSPEGKPVEDAKAPANIKVTGETTTATDNQSSAPADKDLQGRAAELITERDKAIQEKITSESALQVSQHTVNIQKNALDTIKGQHEEAVNKVRTLEDQLSNSVEVKDADVKGLVDVIQNYKNDPDANVEQLIQAANLIVNKYSSNRYSLDRMFQGSGGNKGSYASAMKDNSAAQQNQKTQIDEEKAKLLRSVTV